MKEENSIQGRVSMTSLEGSSSRGGILRKTATRSELHQSVAGKRECIQVKPEMAQGMTVNQPKATWKRVRVKTSRYGYN